LRREPDRAFHVHASSPCRVKCSRPQIVGANRNPRVCMFLPQPRFRHSSFPRRSSGPRGSRSAYTIRRLRRDSRHVHVQRSVLVRRRRVVESPDESMRCQRERKPHSSPCSNVECALSTMWRQRSFGWSIFVSPTIENRTNIRSRSDRREFRYFTSCTFRLLSFPHRSTCATAIAVIAPGIFSSLFSSSSRN